MLINEIELTTKTETTPGVAHIDIDGTQYMVIACNSFVSVIAGKYWIGSRRTLGKAFRSFSDIAQKYKKHGSTIEEYARRLYPADHAF